MLLSALLVADGKVVKWATPAGQQLVNGGRGCVYCMCQKRCTRQSACAKQCSRTHLHATELVPHSCASAPGGTTRAASAGAAGMLAVDTHCGTCSCLGHHLARSRGLARAAEGQCLGLQQQQASTCVLPGL